MSRKVVVQQRDYFVHPTAPRSRLPVTGTLPLQLFSVKCSRLRVAFLHHVLVQVDQPRMYVHLIRQHGVHPLLGGASL